ncbi:MAG: hypothetical protein IH600_02370 [Bacteroidetes bacterium]|nr:hypothetical protein [Bacteroidota bacterium]
MRSTASNIFVAALACLALASCDYQSSTRPEPWRPQYSSLEAAVRDSLGAYELYLSDIGDSLSPTVGKLKNLKTLRIGNSHIRFLPEEFRQLVSLETLILDKTDCADIPPQIYSLTSLREFHFADHRPEDIPDGLAALDLEVLDFTHNYLNSIPEWLQKKNTLRSLDLERNGFSTFCVEEGAFPNLTELVLSQNILIAFHTAPGAFAKLTTLFLGWNKLTAIPEAVDSIAVEWLDLQADPIRTIPRWLQQKRGLEILSFGQNGLASFPSDTGTYKDLVALYIRTRLPDTDISFSY